jgi:hypothetical protein
MPPPNLGVTVIIVSLLVAVWCLVSTLRNRPIDVSHLVGLVIVQALVTAEIVVGISHLASGQYPHEPVTFVGYLIAIFLIPPLAGVLARMEPTRWGSLIALIGCLVVPVLILRINQIWTGIG